MLASLPTRVIGYVATGVLRTSMTRMAVITDGICVVASASVSHDHRRSSQRLGALERDGGRRHARQGHVAQIDDVPERNDRAPRGGRMSHLHLTERPDQRTGEAPQPAIEPVAAVVAVLCVALGRRASRRPRRAGRHSPARPPLRARVVARRQEREPCRVHPARQASRSRRRGTRSSPACARRITGRCRPAAVLRRDDRPRLPPRLRPHLNSRPSVPPGTTKPPHLQGGSDPVGPWGHTSWKNRKP